MAAWDFLSDFFGMGMGEFPGLLTIIGTVRMPYRERSSYCTETRW